MLRPSRVVEQMQGIPFFIEKSSSNCSVCGRPLTAHESVARGIGPVCVRKHMGPGAHPSGSPQSAHAGARATRKPLAESVWGMPTKSRRLGRGESGVEESYVNTYEDGTKVLVKRNVLGSADSERMVYEFSESVGWGIVPETIVPKIGRFADNESVQRWVEGRTMEEIRRAEAFARAPGSPAQIPVPAKSSRMLTMDTLLGNHDRHLGNVLVDKGGKQWAIDNNLAFGGRYAASYGRIPRYGEWVARGWEGRITAAKDVARWHKTPAYREYVGKLRKTHGHVVARQFKENVRMMAKWSEKAKVVE